MWKRTAGAVMALGLIATACGSDDDSDSDGGGGGGDTVAAEDSVAAA